MIVNAVLRKDLNETGEVVSAATIHEASYEDSMDSDCCRLEDGPMVQNHIEEPLVLRLTLFFEVR